MVQNEPEVLPTKDTEVEKAEEVVEETKAEETGIEETKVEEPKDQIEQLDTLLQIEPPKDDLDNLTVSRDALDGLKIDGDIQLDKLNELSASLNIPGYFC